MIPILPHPTPTYARPLLILLLFSFMLVLRSSRPALFLPHGFAIARLFVASVALPWRIHITSSLHALPFTASALNTLTRSSRTYHALSVDLLYPPLSHPTSSASPPIFSTTMNVGRWGLPVSSSASFLRCYPRPACHPPYPSTLIGSFPVSLIRVTCPLFISRHGFGVLSRGTTHRMRPLLRRKSGLGTLTLFFRTTYVTSFIPSLTLLFLLLFVFDSILFLLLFVFAFCFYYCLCSTLPLCFSSSILVLFFTPVRFRSCLT